MSFAEPILLAGFILVPLALLAYGSMQRRRQRESAAWANPALVPGLTTARPGWRRHLPPFLLLLALCALVFALARPQRTVAAPQRAANIVMVTDISGSMNATDVQPEPARRGGVGGQDADREGAADVPARPDHVLRLRRAAGRADDRPLADQGRTRPARGRGRDRDGRRPRARAVRGADTGAERGRQRRAPASHRDRPALRRQEHVRARATRLDIAREAGRARIPIYAIALGTPGGEVELRDSFGFLQRVQVPPDTETLKEIARVSGGKSYTATETDKVKEIYANLGTRLSSKSEKREVTAVFAGGAIALLIAAGSLSLRWFGRLI